MKKRIISAVLMIIMLMTVSVSASESRMIINNPSLTISGTTASCKATIIGNTNSDSITATMKLWNGTTCLKTWSDSGKGTLSMSKTAAVSKNKSYKLTVDSTVAGVKQVQKYVFASS